MPTITVTAVISDFDGLDFNPSSVTNLAAFWQDFQTAVANNEHVPSASTRPVQNDYLYQHLVDVIIPELGSDPNFQLLPLPVYTSKKTDTGWDQDDPGVSLLVARAGDPLDEVCCFGINEAP